VCVCVYVHTTTYLLVVVWFVCVCVCAAGCLLMIIFRRERRRRLPWLQLLAPQRLNDNRLQSTTVHWKVGSKRVKVQREKRSICIGNLRSDKIVSTYSLAHTYVYESKNYFCMGLLMSSESQIKDPKSFVLDAIKEDKLVVFSKTY